jgi:NADH:ubiquinone oxidoreductase subunit 4 (subunit M)
VSSIDHHEPMQWATKRTKRFVAYATIAFAALFLVLAVKAQIIPAPTWQNLPPYYETTR